MKECKYCGTQYEDSLKFCPSCGANAVVTVREKAEEEMLYQKEQENQRRSVEAPRDNLRELIKKIAIAVVAIVAIITVVSLVMKYIPVNDGYSRNDMDKAYDSGVEYYNDKNYVSAIEELSKVSKESGHYDEAKTLIEEAKEGYTNDVLSTAQVYAVSGNYEAAYSTLENAAEVVGDGDNEKIETQLTVYRTEWVNSILAQAEKYAADGDYRTAISIVESGVQKISNNTDLTIQLTRYKEANKAQIKEKVLALSTEYIEQKNYASAIQALQAAIRDVDGDIELSSLLEKYINEYRALIIEQADAALTSEGYEAAIEKAREGLAVLTNDAQLLSAIENYETYAPVWLKDLDYFDRKGEWNNSEYIEFASYIQKDNLGNERYYALRQNIYEIFVGNYSITFALNGKYSTLTGSIFQLYERRSYAGTNEFEIYGDDSLLWSGTMTSGLDPIEFSINISGVNKLKICISGRSINGNSPGASMGDLRLYK